MAVARAPTLVRKFFRMADDGLAEVCGDVSDNNFDDAKEAEANCPVSVITIE